MNTDDHFNGRELLKDLASDVDDVEKALQPLLNPASFLQISNDLPLLDRAKFNVLTAYTIESLIFSSLRLAGQDAKKHEVFTELARVRQYFDKIKKAEAGANGGAAAQAEHKSSSLNKDAATRLIKGDLAGNERFDRERAAALEAQKLRAREKLEKLDLSAANLNKLDDDGKSSDKTKKATGKRKRAVDMLSSGPASSKATSNPSTPVVEEKASPVEKRLKTSKTAKTSDLETDKKSKKGSSSKDKKSKSKKSKK